MAPPPPLPPLPPPASPGAEAQEVSISINGTSYLVSVHRPSIGATGDDDCQPVPVCRFKSKSECVVTKAKRSRPLSPVSQEGAALSEDIYICSESGCGKHAHMVCYNEMISKGDLVSGLEPSCIIPFACSVRCMKKLLKEEPKDKSHEHKTAKFWDNDGSDTSPSSLDILLQWLTDQGNAAKYFGAKDTTTDSVGFNADDGVTKQGLCNEISQIILQKNGKC